MVRALMRPICGFLELDLFIGQEKKKSKKGTKKGKGEKHIEKVETNRDRGRSTNAYVSNKSGLP